MGRGERHGAMFTLHGNPPFAGDLTPLQDFPLAFLDPAMVQSMSKKQIETGPSQLDAFPNPTLTDAEAVACNGCHVAEQLRTSVLAQRADAPLPVSSALFVPLRLEEDLRKRASCVQLCRTAADAILAKEAPADSPGPTLAHLLQLLK